MLEHLLSLALGLFKLLQPLMLLQLLLETWVIVNIHLLLLVHLRLRRVQVLHGVGVWVSSGRHSPHEGSSVHLRTGP